MNKIPHATQPIICPDCLAAIERDAATEAPWADHVVYCPHTLTFGLACVRQGTIAQWDLIAPMLPENVADARKRMRDDAQARGLPFLTPGVN